VALAGQLPLDGGVRGALLLGCALTATELLDRLGRGALLL
jgi:hypothetical protein